MSVRERAKIQVSDCVAELYTAVLDAQGDPRGILDMTLREFCVNVAAQNGIKFMHWPTWERKQRGLEDRAVPHDWDYGTASDVLENQTPSPKPEDSKC